MKIGVTDANVSAMPFNPTFKEFTLVNDVAIIDALFGDSTK
jgi:hypothetical protein